MAEVVRDIDLITVFTHIKCIKDKHDKAKWHTPVGIISVTGQKFMNWTQGIGGGGAIDLVIHIKGYDFKAAVIWLFENFPTPYGFRRKSEVPPDTPLRLPERDNEKLPYVMRYLKYERCIPQSIVNYLVDVGKLYSDKRSNAVFLLLGKKKRVVGAELRNSGKGRFVGLAPGSKKNEGCFYIARSNTMKMVICESAIDAISCFLLHDKVITLSTAGASPNPAWLSGFISKGYEVYCGYDSDKTGDTLAEKMIRMYPKVKRLRPVKHDWNDVLKSISH